MASDPEGSPTRESADDGDPWGFVPKRARPEPSVPDTGPIARAALVGPGLRQRALAMALGLGLVFFAGFLTEIVAASQVLATAGPQWLLLIYPVGGVGLLVVALLQFRTVDRDARLPMLRRVLLGYAIAFSLGIALIVSGAAGPVGAGLVWVLADQMNFLVPLLLWSLVGDEFSAGEGRRVFGWIVAWTYAGQLLGLLVSTLAPLALGPVGVPLSWLLVVDPVVCAAIAIVLPRVLRDSGAGRGHGRDEGFRESFGAAWEIVRRIPAWWSMLGMSTAVFTAGMTAELVYLAAVEDIVGDDVGRLQVVVGAAMLGAFAGCFAIQRLAAARLMERLGIAGSLVVLPVMTAGTGLLLGLGSWLGVLGVVIAGVCLWRLPRWSLDENARRAALALVPDERRARVSFLVDLAPVGIGLVLSGPLALVGVLSGRLWIPAAVVTALAAVALLPGRRMTAAWEAGLLDWRLRRRKQSRSLLAD